MQSLLPVGLSDIPMTKTVKLYCPRCEDIYNPKSSRHGAIDGAYFGTSFPHMLFQVHSNYLPSKNTERYVPRIFGFKVHDIANQQRWQDKAREEFEKKRLEKQQQMNSNTGVTRQLKTLENSASLIEPNTNTNDNKQ